MYKFFKSVPLNLFLPRLCFVSMPKIRLFHWFRHILAKSAINQSRSDWQFARLLHEGLYNGSSMSVYAQVQFVRQSPYHRNTCRLVIRSSIHFMFDLYICYSIINIYFLVAKPCHFFYGSRACLRKYNWKGKVREKFVVKEKKEWRRTLKTMMLWCQSSTVQTIQVGKSDC